MKRLVVFFLVLSMAMLFPAESFAAKKKAKPAKKNPPAQAQEFGWKSVSEMTGDIAQINAAENFVVLKQGKKKILTSGAVLLRVTESGAQTAALLDLVKNQRTHFWVKKTQGPKKEYVALVITQFLGASAIASQPPMVQFSVNASQGAESVNTPSILVTLSKAAAQEVKVSYAVSGTAAGSSTDYTLVNGELMVPAGQTSVSVPLSVVNDSAIESNETVIITLSNPNNAVLGATTVHTYTIQDDDQPAVSFTAAAGSSSESVSSVAIPVALVSASTQEVKVDYSVAGTATGGGVDYTLANGTLTIPAGQTTGTITAAVIDDSAMEPGETIVVTLANPRGAVLGATTTYTHTINDNDQGTIGFREASSSVSEGSTTVSIPVVLSTASSKEIKVNYGVTGGTAGTSTDFTLAAGTLTIPAGQTTGNIVLSVTNDTADELNETVIITLSNPVETALGSLTTHTYTIQDDDEVTIQFQSSTSNGGENTASVSIVVVPSTAPAVNLQVSYAASGTATSGADYTIGNGTLVIPAGSTSANIALTIVDDAVADPSETVIVTLSGPINATLGATTVHTYTINDND